MLVYQRVGYLHWENKVSSRWTPHFGCFWPLSKFLIFKKAKTTLERAISVLGWWSRRWLNPNFAIGRCTFSSRKPLKSMNPHWIDMYDIYIWYIYMIYMIYDTYMYIYIYVIYIYMTFWRLQNCLHLRDPALPIVKTLRTRVSLKHRAGTTTSHWIQLCKTSSEHF